MGRPKAGVRLGGKPLARWGAEALAAVAETCIQVGGSGLPAGGWRRIEDRRPGAGPAAGIEAALEEAAGRPLVAVAVDMPLVTPELLRRLLDLVGDGAVAAAPHCNDRWCPLPAAYAPPALPPLRRWLDGGRRDLHGFLDRIGAAALRGSDLRAVGDPARMLVNVNTPEDLRDAAALLRDARHGTE